jgi:protein-tyrosine phosphatase/membrane-associated phospholipid phosphatase
MSTVATKRPLKRGLLWLVCLAPFFYITYGLANYLAANRAHVPSIVFDWERAIPFIPWTIFPYWSINAFYGLSLLLARDRHELDRHGMRLLFAQIVAVTCFIAMPLAFTFGQPEVTGAPALLFDALRGFDKPFNQAPSLHIALAVILWDFYRRRIHCAAGRGILHVWTLAICGSVLTTYQHHFIDIPTGALLGVVCVWLFPLDDSPNLLRQATFATNAQRRKIGLLYAMGALIVSAGSITAGGAWLWLLWGAVSLLVVSLNYLLFGAAGFQKASSGMATWASRVLLWPYRLGARANVRYWTRDIPAKGHVYEGLYIGQLSSSEPAHTTVDLTAELTPNSQSDMVVHAVPTLDLVPYEPLQFEQAAQTIDRAFNGSKPVLVCCALGFSRSAAACVYWLVSRKRAPSIERAIELVQRARPQIVLKQQWLDAIHTGLRQYHGLH